MSEYTISQVYPTDKTVLAQIDTLLSQEGIRRDGNLDYICAMFDEEYNVIGTGSCFGNTLRCFAVSSAHQGEGLLNQIITHLIEVQCARGNMHLFLYTKVKSSKFFGDLGFYEIARVEDTLVFMENRRDGFGAYLRDLEKTRTGGKSAALVMNANPFTLGHQYLVEKAAAACDTLHLFVVSEDASLVPFAVRRKLVEAGVAHLPNVVLHDSGPYIISNATFPSYFLKDEAAVIDGHARLDLAVFTKIAAALNITARYVGEEPTSQVTGLYNQIMCEQLPKAGIECVVVPRKEANGKAISASTVRQCLQSGDWDTLETLLPELAAAGVRALAITRRGQADSAAPDDPDSYALDEDTNTYRFLGGDPGLPGSDLDLAPGQGFYLWSAYQEGLNGFFRLERAGTFLDKLMAIESLARRDWRRSADAPGSPQTEPAAKPDSDANANPDPFKPIE